MLILKTHLQTWITESTSRRGFPRDEGWITYNGDTDNHSSSSIMGQATSTQAQVEIIMLQIL